jgi:diguanylate cyclase (GGDEF)-like protein
LLKVDLDRFHEVNEALGYEVANHVLQACAARLVARCGPRASVARIGEDCFGILLPQGGIDDATALVPALIEALQEPFEQDGARIYVTTTTGIAVFPKHGDDAEALMRRAAIAAADAKRTRSPYSMHDGEPERESARRLILAGDLRRALGADGLMLVAQPKVDLHTGRVCGAELLARWKHPTLGAISPGEFVPLAEHTGLIKPLTYWVLAAAAQAAHALSRAGLPFPLAVNISTRNLYDPEFVQKLHSLCSAWSLPPERLDLEITETALMEDPDTALGVLRELRARGHELHLDDFGSGYSSLAYLQRLPVSCMKIDRVFIKDVKTDRKAQNIVRFATELARALDMRVVAEGVEDLATMDEITALGCHIAQGYFLARPVALDDLPAVVERLNREHGGRQSALITE